MKTSGDTDLKLIEMLLPVWLVFVIFRVTYQFYLLVFMHLSKEPFQFVLSLVYFRFFVCRPYEPRIAIREGRCATAVYSSN